MITLVSFYEDITAYPVRILSAYLKNKGFQVRLIFLPDLKFESLQVSQSPTNLFKDSVIKKVIALCSESSLIGISLLTPDFLKAVYLTKQLKESLKIPVLWGGKHPSAEPQDSLVYADMVCIGEGEEALAQLLGKIESKQQYYDIQNIWFQQGGRIIENPPRLLNQDLDSIPFPDYSFDNHYILGLNGKEVVPFRQENFREYVHIDGVTGSIPYETLFSRGCPFSCSYCFSFKKIYAGQKYVRFRSTENLMQELKLIREKFDYIQHIWIQDDNIFALSIDKIKEFCQAYKKTVELPMEFAGHPNNINEEKLGYFVDAGLMRIHMGIQSGSKKTQELYKRHVPNEVIIKAANAINKFKKSLFPSYDIIIDNPYENNDDILDTIKLLLKIPRPLHVKSFSLTFFPGTELFEKALQDGTLAKGEKYKAYGKHFLNFYYREKKYLNFVLPLLNKKIPNFIIYLLINKHAIFLLDRPFVMNLLFKLVIIMKSVKKTRQDKTSLTNTKENNYL